MSLPVVIRIPVGGGIGAIEHHSESPESYFAHTPGLRVVACATPQDAYSSLRSAIAGSDPIVFLEPKRRYWSKGEVDTSAPIGQVGPATVRAGRTVTLVAYGPTIDVSIEAARILDDDGVDAEIIDLRLLSPLDIGLVVSSVQRTGHLVVIHEASQSGGLGAEIAARVQREAFFHLEAPVLRVTGYDTPYPPSRAEEMWLPTSERVVKAVYESLSSA